jgi:hypothetical protein
MHREFRDSVEGFSEAEEHATRCCPECLYASDDCVCTDWDEFNAWADELDERDDLDYEDDGQPDEYTEWQDYMGGDDWDHGQYDCCDW